MTPKDLKATTVAVYDRFAEEYAKKFAGTGPRIEDIKQTIDLSTKSNPAVLEIGCGDGRDAVEITKLTNDYLGIDISKQMIALAKDRHPGLRFAVADIEDYKFPNELDIIFAFASLLHSSREVLKEILKKAHQSLNENGLFYISLKEGEYSGPETISDGYGERVFYFYKLSDLEEMCHGYEVVFKRIVQIGETNWLDVILRKK